ncbi:peptidylprolyl isomerase [Halomonadaceae bacterium KBTZ08]
MVVLETSEGRILLATDAENAPGTTGNFLSYVDSGFFDGLIFHRVISNFMIQTGGFGPDMEPRKPGEPIRNEADNGLSNKRGTVAMARTMSPHTASSQFFINVNDNGFLDHTAKTQEGWGYCVFATVAEGMDVVDRIRDKPTTARAGHRDVPVEDVIIHRAYRTDEEATA